MPRTLRWLPFGNAASSLTVRVARGSGDPSTDALPRDHRERAPTPMSARLTTRMRTPQTLAKTRVGCTRDCGKDFSQTMIRVLEETNERVGTQLRGPEAPPLRHRYRLGTARPEV